MRRLLYAIAMVGLVSNGCGNTKEKSAGSGSTASASGSGAATASAVDAAPADQAQPTPSDDGLADHGTGQDGRSLYYARPLTEADLAGRTLRDLALMRNTVYARAGHTFRKAWLRDHFTAMAWYRALPQDDSSKVSDVDRANVKLIAARENAIPRDQLVERRAALQAATAPSAAEQVELRLLNEQLGGTGGGAAGGGQARVSPLEDPSRLDDLLTLEDLADLSQRDLRILRNTVYARHGREFKSDTLIAWFSDKDWYKPDPDFTDARLTAIDRKNVKLIRSVEDSLGGPISEHDQKAEEGWFDGA